MNVVFCFPSIPGARRKSKKRQAKLDRAGSTEATQAMSSGDAAASDGDTLSNGDTPAKSGKHRIRLWDSFLSKTRKIRIRKSRDSSSSGLRSPTGEASKLQARASSQPNIPTSADKENFRSRPMSASSPDESNKTFPGAPSNGGWRGDSIEDDVDHVNKATRRRDDDGNEEDDEDEDAPASDIRRAAYRRAPELAVNTRTRSSSSNDDLEDSAHDDLSPPAAPSVNRARVGRRFFHRQTPDEGYRSQQDQSGNVDKVSRLPPSGQRKSRSKSADRPNSVDSTPRRDDAVHEPRTLRREELQGKDSLQHSEDGEKGSTEDLLKDDQRDREDREEAEQEEDGVPVIEQTDLQVG